MLNNREFANLILLIGFALAVGIGTRKSLGPKLLGLLQHLKAPSLLLVLVALIGYVVGVVIAAARLGVWDRTMLYGTAVWFVTVATVSFFNVDRARTDRHFVRSVMLRSIEIAAILEFAASLYVFNLVTELLLQAALVAVTVLVAAASQVEEHLAVERLGNRLLGLAGVTVLAYSTWHVLADWTELDTGTLAFQALLPVWLTVAFAPLLYIFSLYVGYDSAARRLWYRGEDVPVGARLRALVALAMTFRGRRASLGRLDLYTARQMVLADNLSEAMGAARRQLDAEDRRAQKELEAERRLVENAGAEGTDEHGRQLDQREFEETRSALRWLSTCHGGHYSNQGGYRDDLLDLVDGPGPFAALPDEHGVRMTVSADAQSWWAWRRTVTGWVFGIGADGPPPSTYLYDGPIPPDNGPANGGSAAWRSELDPDQPPNW